MLYTKRPYQIEAVQFSHDPLTQHPGIRTVAVEGGVKYEIDTHEGPVELSDGDYILADGCVMKAPVFEKHWAPSEYPAPEVHKEKSPGKSKH